MTTKLPSSLARLHIKKLGISVRSCNALRSKGLNYVGQIVLLSDHELMKIKNLGRTSLEDIRGAIRNLLSAGANSNLYVPPEGMGEETATSGRQGGSLGGWSVPRAIDVELDVSVDVLELSVRASNVLKRLEVTSVRQLLNFSKRNLAGAQNFGRTSLAEIEAKLGSYLSGLDPESLPTNELAVQRGSGGASLEIKEYVTRVLPALSERQRTILADRYGLWDGIAETLQDIGDKLGLTRERIRQIETKAIKKVNYRLHRFTTVESYISQRIDKYLELDEEGTCGFLSEDEVLGVLAGHGSTEEAGLALEFLQDICCPGKSLLARSLVEVGEGVYSVHEEARQRFLEVLEWIELSLQRNAKPLTEDILLKEMVKTAGHDLTPRQMRIASRVLSISPRISALSSGFVTLVAWKEHSVHDVASGHDAPSGVHDAASAAEATLKLLGRPAHFREITEKALAHFKDFRKINAATLHNALVAKRKTFVWVKAGTYGLAAWGLTKPPYIKDRLLELLSEAPYPLPYWHLEEKVLEVSNCKPASVRMTLDLNPKVFKRFKSDQYGLAQHYSPRRSD